MSMARSASDAAAYEARQLAGIAALIAIAEQQRAAETDAPTRPLPSASFIRR